MGFMFRNLQHPLDSRQIRFPCERILSTPLPGDKLFQQKEKRLRIIRVQIDGEEEKQTYPQLFLLCDYKEIQDPRSHTQMTI